MVGKNRAVRFVASCFYLLVVLLRTPLAIPSASFDDASWDALDRWADRAFGAVR